MKKRLLILMAFAPLATVAQEMPYTLTVLNEEYSELSEAESANENETWDDPELFVPMGFTFQFIDELMTDVLVLPPGSQLINPINEDSVHFLEPYFADIVDAGYDTASLSPILFVTEGMPGSRIFKMEWRDVAFYNEWAEGSTSNRTHFQVWLYEGTNVIEYRYGSNTIKSGDFIHFANGAPLIGLGTNANVMGEGGWENFWLLYGDPTNPQVMNYLNPNLEAPSLDGEPPAGTVYRFTPTFVGVEEKPLSRLIHVYPSITSGVLNITWDDDRAPIAIYDVTGKAVMQNFLVRGTQQLDVTTLSAGQYILGVSHPEGVYTQVFTKQ